MVTKGKKVKLPKLLQKGYLKVSFNHSLYYEVCGNPRGVPVLFCQGGPGGSFKDKHKLLFTDSRTKSIFLDQRGCGRSKTSGALIENTTGHLVNDMAALLDYLGLSKVALFGTSWGSTVALCFAISHPQRVNAMLLTGVYLGTRAENDYLYRGGTKNFIPDIWQEVFAKLPSNCDPLKWLWLRINGRDKRDALLAVKQMALLESAIFSQSVSLEDSKEYMRGIKLSDRAKIGAHYMINDCFLPPNYIMSNIHKILKIPTWIVSGRHDLICPPMIAFNLHKELPRSKITIVHGGHSLELGYKQEAIQKSLAALIKAVK